MNLSGTTDFSLLCVEYISMLLFFKNDFIDLLQNFLPLSTHTSFGLQLDSFKIFKLKIIFQRNNPCVFTENVNNT